MNNKKKRKAIALSLVLAVMTLTASNLAAQNENGGGLFGRGMTSDNAKHTNGGFINVTRDINVTVNSDSGDGFTNEEFGAPLGSGLAILLGAGLGYVALKKKEDEQ